MLVLVTRPEPGASRTASVLRERGHVPLLLPMTRIVDIAVNSAAFGGAGAYAVTSANAVRGWQSLGIAPESAGRPLYAVGERSGEIAAAAGFSDVRPGGGDGAGLAATILADLESGALRILQSAPLVYAAGRTRHGGFEDALKARGIPLKVVELYDIEEISYTTDLLFQTLSDGTLQAVLLYSAKSAEAFFQTFEKHGLFKLLKDCRFLCMSDQVRQAVPAGLEQWTAVAERPDEDSLLKLLDRIGDVY